jgi:hypothetical protein
MGVHFGRFPLIPTEKSSKIHSIPMAQSVAIHRDANQQGNASHQSNRLTMAKGIHHSHFDVLGVQVVLDVLEANLEGASR